MHVNLTLAYCRFFSLLGPGSRIATQRWQWLTCYELIRTWSVFNIIPSKEMILALTIVSLVGFTVANGAYSCMTTCVIDCRAFYWHLKSLGSGLHCSEPVIFPRMRGWASRISWLICSEDDCMGEELRDQEACFKYRWIKIMGPGAEYHITKAS